MDLKKLAIKGRLTSTKGRMSNLLRIISTSRNESPTVSTPIAVMNDARYEPLNLLTSYYLQVDLKRAEGIDGWRRWLDKPK